MDEKEELSKFAELFWKYFLIKVELQKWCGTFLSSYLIVLLIRFFGLCWIKIFGRNEIEITNFHLVILAIQYVICNIFWSKRPLCVSASPFSSSCYCVIKQSGPICLRAAGSWNESIIGFYGATTVGLLFLKKWLHFESFGPVSSTLNPIKAGHKTNTLWRRC